MSFCSSTLECSQLLSWLEKVSPRVTLLKVRETWERNERVSQSGLRAPGDPGKAPLLLRGDSPHCPVPSCSHNPDLSHSHQPVPS